MGSMVEAFSFSPKDMDEVSKAKETARRNGLSFSAYVMELLREENKKNEEPHADPLNLPRQRVTQSDISMQFDILNLSQKGINEYLNLLCNDNEIKQLKILRDKGFQVYTVSKKKIDLLNRQEKVIQVK